MALGKPVVSSNWLPRLLSLRCRTRDSRLSHKCVLSSGVQYSYAGSLYTLFPDVIVFGNVDAYIFGILIFCPMVYTLFFILLQKISLRGFVK